MFPLRQSYKHGAIPYQLHHRCKPVQLLQYIGARFLALSTLVPLCLQVIWYLIHVVRFTLFASQSALPSLRFTVPASQRVDKSRVQLGPQSSQFASSRLVVRAMA